LCVVVAESAGLDTWAGRFALLGDPGRLTLLLIIQQAGHIGVSELIAATGRKESTVSQALRLLRAHGVVTSERTGTRVSYSIADETVDMMLKHVNTTVPAA
jgi:DNA-binding transcriptional ArsR family regulator